jgi:alpha-glucosidase
MLLLTLRGTPVLYYGDELAMPQAQIPPERVVDPQAARDPEWGRDGARTPMPWSAEPGAGFTSGDAQPWLPFGPLAGVDVATQRSDPGSALNLTRDLIGLRRAEQDLRTGAYAEVAAKSGLWAYRRGDGFLVALNLGADAASVPADGTIAIGTHRQRDGEAIARSLLLAPGEGAVLRLAR